MIRVQEKTDSSHFDSSSSHSKTDKKPNET